MKEKTDRKTVKGELGKQLETWQTKMDEAKLQMHLGVKEVQDKIKPHVDRFEQELNQATIELEKLEESTEGALGEVKAGVESSIETMKMAFESAQQHFTKKQK